MLSSPNNTLIDAQVSSINEKVSATVTHLTAEHQAHIASRRINLPWAAANCKSFDIPTAALMLDYPALSPGIMLISDEYGQWQFKPDEPWASKDGKIPKYRTPKHEYDAFLAKHPEIEGYWRDLDALKARCFTINGKPYLVLTEGGFKGITGCMHDIPTVALVGVTMGLTPRAKGEPDLIPALKRLAEAGFNFIIAFDADAATNKNVRTAERKIVKVLLSYGVLVRTVTGHWDAEEDGKGMDDFINNKGIEEFRAILLKSETYGIEPLVSGDRQKATKPPTPRQTAAVIAEEYGNQWKFDNEQKEWRIYSGKHWEKVEIGNFESLLMRVVDSKNIPYTGDAYLTDVLKLLTKMLREKHWGGVDRRRFINFSNCVLDGNSGTTREHQPGDRFTSYLPFEHKPLKGDIGNALQALEANCPNINTWMRTAMKSNAKKIFKLLAIINGCLRFSFHGWQQFVHLIGAPGSGKGTFARLLEKIVGKDNTQPCSLDSLKDGSTLASIIDKQLVVFGDERKPVGVESILRLTGGDSVNYREVYRPAANAYFYGLLLICSNDPIFMGNTTGLERRLCLVEFNNPIPKALRNSEMEASFDSEIASLIAIALSLPSSEVKQAVQGIGDAEIADFKAAEWEMKIRMDSLAAFFEMELIVEDGAQIRAGDLFNRYKDFCEEIKKPAMSLTTFSPGLEKLFNELHQPVIRDRSGRHVTFIGLRLRRENDEHPTYSQKLAAIAGLDKPIAGLNAGLNAGLATIQSKDLQDLQDLTPNILENCQISEKQPSATEIVEIVETKKEVTPPSPAVPVKPLPSKAPSPAQSPAKASKTPAPSPATKRHHKEFKVGDRVRILDSGLHHEKDGEVVAVSFGKVENDYVIALDKESHLSRQAIVTVPHSQKFPILMKL
jgi:putative DNA primase/helicase